jgi:hypothetical protein
MCLDTMNNELIDKLFEAAIEADRRLHSREELERILANEDSGPISRVHDWRNHVSEVVADNWGDPPIEAKLVAFTAAASLAHAEEWD